MGYTHFHLKFSILHISSCSQKEKPHLFCLLWNFPMQVSKHAQYTIKSKKKRGFPIHRGGSPAALDGIGRTTTTDRQRKKWNHQTASEPYFPNLIAIRSRWIAAPVDFFLILGKNTQIPWNINHTTLQYRISQLCGYNTAYSVDDGQRYLFCSWLAQSRGYGDLRTIFLV